MSEKLRLKTDDAWKKLFEQYKIRRINNAFMEGRPRDVCGVNSLHKKIASKVQVCCFHQQSSLDIFHP